MVRKAVAIAMMIVLVALIIWIIVLVLNNGETSHRPTTSIASTTTTKSTLEKNKTQIQNEPLSNIDSAIIASFIGLVGIIITGGLAIYQMRHNIKLQRQMQNIQHKHEQDILQNQREIDKKFKDEELKQEQQRKNVAAANNAMIQAQNIEERILAYKEALRVDPNISSLKILDMPSPLKVTSVYVRLRLHREARPVFGLDSAFHEAETFHDPEALMRAGQIYLKNRFNTALEPDEAIHAYKRCILVGDPGAGKSTLLKYLTLKSLDGQLTGLPDLPIHIDLNQYANSKFNNLIDFAVNAWDEKYGFPPSQARKAIVDRLRNGKAILLLDALDETVVGETNNDAETSYQRVINAIMHMATRYHQSPVVVTARKAGYQQRTPLAGFTELEVLEFRPQDTQQFINNWFSQHADPKRRNNATELNAKLERNPRIQTIASNPLLLSLIVIVYEAQLDLPDRRAELYKQCIETLLVKWDASRNIRRRRQFSPDHKQQLLEEVAWHFHNQGKRYLPEEDLLNIIAEFLPAIGLPSEQNKDVLLEIANENGLLKEQARGVYAFLHLTLQEYFVARRVADKNQLGLLLSHWGEPWWEEVILLFAGYISDASLLLKMLIGPETMKIRQNVIFYSNLILAGRCLASRPIVRQHDLRENIVRGLFEALLKTPYSLTRQQIANTLAEIGGQEINTRLLDLVSNTKTHIFVSLSIVTALGKIGEKGVTSSLVQLLQNPQVGIRLNQAIAFALGEIGDRSTVTILVRMLEDTKIYYKVRESIAIALGEIGDRSISDKLVHLLSSSHLPPSERGKIAITLGKIGDRSIAPILLKLLSSQLTNENIACDIADALGILGEKSIVPDLLQYITNPHIDSHIGQRIALSLEQLGDQSAVPTLLSVLSDPQVAIPVRQKVAYALGSLGDRSIIPQLVKILLDLNIDINLGYAIVKTLTILGGYSIAPDLLQILVHQNTKPELQIYIIDNLGLLGNHSVISTLSYLLNKSQFDLNAKRHIINTLGRLGKASIRPQVFNLLSDPFVTTNLQKQVPSTLVALNASFAVPVLLNMLSDDTIDLHVRVEIAKAVSQLNNDKATLEKLSSFLSDSKIGDYIHRILWEASRRNGIRIGN